MSQQNHNNKWSKPSTSSTSQSKSEEEERALQRVRKRERLRRLSEEKKSVKVGWVDQNPREQLRQRSRNRSGHSKSRRDSSNKKRHASGHSSEGDSIHRSRHASGNSSGGDPTKGKSYKTRYDKEPKEISREKHFEKNYIKSGKPGGRNINSAFGMRNYQDHRLGSGVELGKTPKKRMDRPGSFDDSDSDEEWYKSPSLRRPTT